MTPNAQPAPGETGQDLNDPQPDIYGAPGQTSEVTRRCPHPGRRRPVGRGSQHNRKEQR
ncbi:MAG: hypothetical protein V3T84_00415 [Phycisphaerales bacterium]